MTELVSTILEMLDSGADASAWLPLLAEEATFESLKLRSTGAPAVADWLGSSKLGELNWSHQAKGGRELFFGEPEDRFARRAMVLSLGIDGGRLISSVLHQNRVRAPQQAGALVMDDELRTRLDNALAEGHPISIAYVDDKNRPVLSLRGSIKTYDEGSLAVWIRNAEGGLVSSIAKNPHVALLYRDEDSKATFRMQGRAAITIDEDARSKVFEAAPEVERAHDFARLGVAAIIELDFVEGYHGLSPDGPIRPIRLSRTTCNAA